MKKLSWNDARAIGLVMKINSEVLHPMGLAMAVDTKANNSPFIYIAPDGIFEFDEAIQKKVDGLKSITNEQFYEMACDAEKRSNE